MDEGFIIFAIIAHLIMLVIIIAQQNTIIDAIYKLCTIMRPKMEPDDDYWV